ncbi:MAG: hypothetical protein Q9220_006437 [cf. Caloplaca sp. 1 TL-2023]
MGAEPFSIVAPARVKVLCIPVGQIRAFRFRSFLERLEQDNVVPLQDVSPDSRPHRTLFSPLAFPAGRVLFDIITSAPAEPHLALSPFELFRRAFIVVGIADSRTFQKEPGSDERPAEKDGKDVSSPRLSDVAIQMLLRHKERLESNFPSALVHTTIVFDCDLSDLHLPQGLAAVPSPTRSKTTTIKTMLCDLTSQMLAEMASFTRSLQESDIIETPKAQRQITDRPLARYNDSSRPASTDPRQPLPSGVNGANRNDHRMSMPAHLLGNLNSRSSTPEGRSMSPANSTQSPPPILDGATSNSASPSSGSADRPRPMSRDRASMQGFGPNSLLERERNKSRGRLQIAIGSLYLLAGRWSDAVKELVDGATVAKTSSDHAWHGKALDYLLVVCILYAWAGIEFRIPQVLYAAAESPSSGLMKSSKETPASSQADVTAISTAASRDTLLQNLSSLLPELATTIQNLSSRAWTFSEDRIPQLSFSHCGLRFAKLLTILATADGKFTDANLGQIVLNEQPTRQDRIQLISNPFRGEIHYFLLRSFPDMGVDESLTVADRTNILAGMSTILAQLGYRRKRAYILKEILDGLIPALVEARKKGAAEMGVHPAASLASLDAALIGTRKTSRGVAYGEDEFGIQCFLQAICKDFGIDSWARIKIERSPREKCQERPPKTKASQGDPSLAGSLGGSNIPDVASRVDEEPLNSGSQSEMGLQNDEGQDEDLKASQDQETLYQAMIKSITQRAIQQIIEKYSGSTELKIDILRICINLCEALPDLEGVLRFSAELLRTSGSGIAPGPDDSGGSAALPVEDQLRLWNNISRTIGVARQLGMSQLAAEYWDDFLVRGIEIVPPTTNMPIAHAKDELESVKRTRADIGTGPFLYNPFGQSNKAKKTTPMMVAGEEAVFRVTLQNLYDFDLEIESLRLASSNDECNTLPQEVTIGPYRTQTVYLIAIQPGSGQLIINGCVAKVRGCRERWFPLFNVPWSPVPDVKLLQSHHAEPASLLESVSDSAKGSEQKGLRSIREPTPSSLVLNVITALPNIILKASSLSQSAIMLLEGETKTFTITLHNASASVAADFVLLTFEDSMASQLRAAMTSNELSSTELHELQLAASKKPLRLCQTADEEKLVIEPGKDVIFKLEVTGTPGLSNANIQVSYGHLGVPRAEVTDTFHTRQILIPLTITVNASIEVARTDLLPFSASFAWQNQQRQLSQPNTPTFSKADSRTPNSTRRHSSTPHRSKSNKHLTTGNHFQSLLSRIGLSTNNSDDERSHCLLSLDIRNSWPTPLSISIQVRSPSPPSSDRTHTPRSIAGTDGKPNYTVHESLQPGHTKRLLLLLPRLRLTNTTAPIPSLEDDLLNTKKKQFVISSSSAGKKADPETIYHERENFWYREAMLGMLHATWTEESTHRTGVVNLRKNVRLDARGVQVLRMPEVEVRMAVSAARYSSTTDTSSSPPVTQIGANTYIVSPSVSLTLTAHITNHDPDVPIHPLLRLQPLLKDQVYPVAVELGVGSKFLVHGLLQQVLSVLSPGGGMESVEVGFTVLGRGKWVVGGVVEEVVRRGGGGKDDEGMGRRVWGVEEGVVVICCDEEGEDDE